MAIGVFDYLFCTPLNYLGHNTHNYWLIPILFIFALYTLFLLNISFCFFLHFQMLLLFLKFKEDNWLKHTNGLQKNTTHLIFGFGFCLDFRLYIF